MKKLLISTVFAVLTMCVLNAQDVKFGIRGGMNISNMSVAESTPISEGYSSRVAPGWGIFTELQYNPMLSFRLGVEYSSLGGKRNGMQAMPTQRIITELGGNLGMTGTDRQFAALGLVAISLPDSYYSNIKNTTKLDYVTIPLLLQFGRDIGESPWRVYVNAGPYVSFILSGKQDAKGVDKLYFGNAEGPTLWDVFPQRALYIVETIPEIEELIPDAKSLISEVGILIPGIEEKLNNPVHFDETNITGEMRSANFGIAGNIGIRYQRNRNYFFLEAGGNYGFFSVQHDNANGSNRLGAITVMAGYAFSLF